MTQPVEGETSTFERTFTGEEVRQFGDLSGDTQPRHTEPNEDGEVMVQGLLTATLPTKMGSDNEMLASTMEFPSTSRSTPGSRSPAVRPTRRFSSETTATSSRRTSSVRTRTTKPCQRRQLRG